MVFTKRNLSATATLLAGLVLSALINRAAYRLPSFPGESPVAILPESAVETAALVGLGMRRFAADINFIRLFIYFGTPEKGMSGYGYPLWATRPETTFEGGTYAELKARAQAIMELDPSFSYVALFVSASLAFDLKRPDEALSLLAEALRRDPQNKTYKAYIGAIGVSRHGNKRRVISILTPFLEDADCPVMIKSLVAFLHYQLREFGEALRLYREIMKTSKDEGYRELARRQIQAIESSASSSR